jgi:hypothetical protein
MSTATVTAKTDLLSVGSSLEGMSHFLDSWHQIATGILNNQNVNSAEEAAEVNNQLHVLLESIPLKAAQLFAMSGEVCAISSEMTNA